MATLSDHLIPVILAGGSGTRLWPVSRSYLPKHLVALTSSDTMLQSTARRLQRLAGHANILTVGSIYQQALIKKQLSGLEPSLGEHILLEPAARNTAAAVAIAAHYVASTWGGDKVMFVCPSDHLILSEARLKEALNTSLETACSGTIVTFGIHAARPETGFGYIARGEELSEGVFAVERFIEKPPFEKAQEMVDEGGFDWNSGMFFMRADTLLEELQTHDPAIAQSVENAFSKAQSNGYKFDEDDFNAIPSEPIDKAVMERSEKMAVVPCDPRWSDVGSWHALWEIMDKDLYQNVIDGDVEIQDASRNLIKAQSRLVAVAGVDDLAIIETPDAVLISAREYSEGVKAIAARLAKEKRKEAFSGVTSHSDYGSLTVLDDAQGYLVEERVFEHSTSGLLSGRGPELWTILEGMAELADNLEVRWLEPGIQFRLEKGETYSINHLTHGPLKAIVTVIKS